MNFLYFDPGIGAMLAQVAVAGIAAVVLFSKAIMYKVKSFFGLTKEKEDTYDSIDVEEEDTDTDDKKN